MFSTRTGSSKWYHFLRPSKPGPKEPDKEEDQEPEVIKFDPKYKAIVKVNYGDRQHFDYDNDMMTWVSMNCPGSVDVKFPMDGRYYLLGFENPDDATFFKIKYSI